MKPTVTGMVWIINISTQFDKFMCKCAHYIAFCTITEFLVVGTSIKRQDPLSICKANCISIYLNVLVVALHKLGSEEYLMSMQPLI